MVISWFWDVAARVNAQRVLLWVCLGCLFLLGAVVLGGRMLDARATLALPISTQQSPVEVAPAVAAPTPRPTPATNPFASRFLTELLRREDRLRREEEEARRRNEAPPPVVAEPEPPPVQGPPRPEVRLLYRGMFTRPDGTVLALIENQSAAHTAFHQAGDQIEGLTVGAMTAGHLELIRDNQVEVTLDAGVPASYQPEP